ncbi:APPL2 isoform 16 [Pongo abelii]|uniref:APPL2 isoform 16 n=1 Tax=Pongo abelii TaxID=9601 RepID=A0A2J8XM04_PONAB|nr:APPL2 isoform 16 [Pongo abelii]
MSLLQPGPVFPTGNSEHSDLTVLPNHICSKILSFSTFANHYFSCLLQICYAINLGKEIIEVQKDPEALAQLMLSIPLTNDGKYVLLNDQPDDNDGNPNEHRGAESEA